MTPRFRALHSVSLSVLAVVSLCASACAVSSEEELGESEDELEVPVERTTSGKADLTWNDGEEGEKKVAEDSLERMIQDDPVAQCTACADDEWGAYVRQCCLTSSTGKFCWQEACQKPVEEDLPFDPGDPSTRPPSVSVDPIDLPGLSP